MGYETETERRRKFVAAPPVGDETTTAAEREEVKTYYYRSTTDWSHVAFIIGLVVLVILCVGEPDLLDAITSRVKGQP